MFNSGTMDLSNAFAQDYARAVTIGNYENYSNNQIYTTQTVQNNSQTNTQNHSGSITDIFRSQFLGSNNGGIGGLLMGFLMLMLMTQLIPGLNPPDTDPPDTTPLDEGDVTDEQAALDLLGDEAVFQATDTDGNGFLTNAELQTFFEDNPDISEEVKTLLLERNHELMFASIQVGRDSYQGIHQNDVAALTTRLEAGETLTEIADDLRETYAAERRLPNTTPDAFETYVSRMRYQRNRLMMEELAIQGLQEGLAAGETSIDTDGNGFIDRTELTAYLEAHKDIAPQLRRQLLNNLDILETLHNDETDEAVGLSETDLAETLTRIQGGESIRQIINSL